MIKPMLANNKEYDLERDILTRYPITDFLVSPKLDGVRCLLGKNFHHSRSGKSFPSVHVHRMLDSLQHFLPDDAILDGEIILCDKKTGRAAGFHDTQSVVMSCDKEFDTDNYMVWFMAFDCIRHNNFYAPAHERVSNLNTLSDNVGFLVVNSVVVQSKAQLDQYLEGWLAEDNEGAMLRHRLSPYKQGRATLREAYLLKYVVYRRITCVIVDMKEAMENIDTSCKKKENLFGKGTLGSLVVKCPGEFGDATFGVGTGFNASLAQFMWDCKHLMIGKHIEVSYKPHGTKDVPRQPVFVGMRPECD